MCLPLDSSKHLLILHHSPAPSLRPDLPSSPLIAHHFTLKSNPESPQGLNPYSLNSRMQAPWGQKFLSLLFNAMSPKNQNSAHRKEISSKHLHNKQQTPPLSHNVIVDKYLSVVPFIYKTKTISEQQCMTHTVSMLSHIWLCNCTNGSLQGSSVHGISQARILEWVAISFSRGSFQPRDQNQVSCGSCISRWIL